MKSALILMGLTLLSVTVFAKETAKFNPKWKNKIVCKESLGSEADGNDDGGEEWKPVGTYTIELNNDKSIKSIQIERAAVKDIAPISLLLTSKYAKFKHDMRDNDPQLAETWGIKRIEAIEATLANGDKLLIRINDHTYAGPVGSNVFITIGGRRIDTSKTSMTDCLGDIKKMTVGQLLRMQ